MRSTKLILAAALLAGLASTPALAHEAAHPSPAPQHRVDARGPEMRGHYAPPGRAIGHYRHAERYMRPQYRPVYPVYYQPYQAMPAPAFIRVVIR